MKNAKATTKGWVNPKTGELLKAQKMTQEQADKLNGVVPAPVVEAPKPKKTRKPKAAPTPVVEEEVIEEVVEDEAPSVEVEEVEQPAPVQSFWNKLSN
jgi:hypothetical protein